MYRLTNSIIANRHAVRFSLLVMFCCLLGATPATAQSRTDIAPQAGDQKLGHNERAEPQVFNPTLWDVDSKTRFGATVALSCEPFQSTVDPSSQVDSQLTLRVNRTQVKPNWRVRIATDRTNVNRGNTRATVVAASEDRGKGILELLVTFLGADVFDLVEGDYSTTVTGTITAH